MKTPTLLHDQFQHFLASPEARELPPKIVAILELAFLCGAISYRKADSDTADNPLLHMYLAREINDWTIKILKEGLTRA